MKTASLNILLVTAPLSTKGGTIRRLELWGRYLSQKMKLSLLFYSTAPDNITPRISEGITCIPTQTMNRFGRILILPAALRILWSILKCRPDYVLAMFLWPGLASGIAIQLARILGLKSVRLGLHIAGDPIPPSLCWSPRTWIYALATKISLALADDIIAISPGIIELLQSKYGVPEGKAIHLAPISVEQHELKKNWRDTNGQIHFGIFARLSSDKGIQYALKALAKLHAEGTKATLDIYGEGNYSQQLLNLTKNLGLQEIVRFHTWVAQPLNQMLKIDCLLLPSLSEGTPRCILEAASLGIPCIATLVGGVPDIIDHGKTGWLVPFGHPPKLAEAMRRVIVDPLILIKAGTQAMAKIQSSHSIANEITNLTRVFEQVNAP